MKGTATRTTRTKKKDKETGTDNKTATKTKSSATRPTLGRSKTDAGTKKTKPSKLAGVSSTDYKNLPSYMQHTQSSMRNKTTGSLGADEKEKEKRKTPTRIPTKPAASKTKASKSSLSTTTTTTTRQKKSKGTPKSPEVDRSPAPSVETPTPKEISTDKGLDASAAVGLAPATPQTPGQDPVPHISDNDSTGGLMETVDENPNDTCNVKQWMLFSEATRETQDLSSHLRSEGDEGTVEIHDDEQGDEFGGPVESGSTNEEEPGQLMTKNVDTAVAEKLVTTETAVVGDDSDEEDSRQNNVDQGGDEEATAVSSRDAPNTEMTTESRSEEQAETAVSVPPVADAEPAGMETTATAAAIQQEETTLPIAQETLSEQPSAEPNVETTNPVSLQESGSAEASTGATSSEPPKKDDAKTTDQVSQETPVEENAGQEMKTEAEAQPEASEQTASTEPVTNNQDETAVAEKEESNSAKTQEENVAEAPDATTSEGVADPAESKESDPAPKA